MRRMARTAAVLTTMLLVGGPRVEAQVSIGVIIAPPPQPRVVAVPPPPRADFVWIEGYWYPVGQQYRWHEGYWTRPPYEGARWFAPRHDGERYYPGYWYGEHGLVPHDHHWDRDRERDFRHHDRR